MSEIRTRKVVIWKYPINVGDTSVIMPQGKVLAFQEQAGQLQIWALVDTESRKSERVFRTVGTGQPFEMEVREGYGYGDGGQQYIATAQSGPLVWHLFEIF